MFEFEVRATEKDPTGYYYPRWDQAEKLTVKAETKARAEEKVKAALGEIGSRRGWPWAITVDSIKEIQPFYFGAAQPSRNNLLLAI